MTAWKQLLLALVVLVAAAAAWVKFFPGASEILAGWGLGWAVQVAGDAKPQGGNGEPRRSGPQTAVITAPVIEAVINDRLSAIGTGRANNSVTVKPYTAGRVTTIELESGAQVDVGTVIARLDSEVEEIALDRAKIALADAEAKLERVRSLRSSNTATQVQVTDAELVVGNAKLGLRDAQLNLDRRAITAPIEGIIGILPVEAGNYVTTDTVVATIDDRSQIKIDFYVPERFAANMAVGGRLTASPIARPDEVFEGTVSAVDNRVDDKSRTLLVQAAIPNDKDTLRAGMSFRVSVKFPGDAYPSVDPLAIQWGTDGAFVWVIRDGKAKRTPVRIVQRNTESVLVSAEGIRPGDTVVTEGVHAVRDGAEVLIARSEPGTTRPAVVGSGS
ncbi:efflux RND transporter periplasmic adaptor subunit [Mesorhizobium sp. YM1C-6-2]|uniref:efflux RND transporter periplasmic adaptor subunit n=1 Tax=Mesorhizobium sp. YM1C-6-2 TaxID=1827501 RepID=UPI000EF230F8|nr:efflux RND transporter periplasmic adaptor subunit [Mesorhizobium sp. YM1C-6-2]RLP26761.1 efflux RND transporter periplasmic adaptor subunit [Mesorhizobium sp. YM1C-6-2]